MQRKLTKTELEILSFASQGYRYCDIATYTNSTTQMVKNRVQGILIKLDCRNMVSAVAAALRQGLIQ